MSHHQVSLTPRGRMFARAVSSIARHGSIESASGAATALYGPSADWEKIIKATVTPITFATIPTDAQPGAVQEFFELALQASIIGRLSGRREVPFLTRLIRMASGARGYWVSQNSPKPLSKPSLAGETLSPLKVASVIVLTKEAVEASGPKGEALFQQDLLRAISEVLDLAFIDVANAGVANEMPASITYGVSPTMASTGSPGDDLVELVERFEGNFDSAYLISDPTTITRMALARDANGSFLFPDLSPKGGSVIGIPVLTSRSSPQDSSGGQLVLVDASAIAVGFNGLAIDRAMQAALQMSDDPDSPATASTEMVSLWQSNLIALRSEIFANWRVERAGAVAVVTGAHYETSTL